MEPLLRFVANTLSLTDTLLESINAYLLHCMHLKKLILKEERVGLSYRLNSFSLLELERYVLSAAPNLLNLDRRKFDSVETNM